MNELFLKIVNMSISASWLILAILILRLVLKHAPKWVRVLLWGLVALRLICPFSIESALSLIPSAETIPLNIELDTTPAINSGISSINSIVNPIIIQSNTPALGASINPLQITLGISAHIWALGIAVLLIYTAISYWRLRRKVDTAVLYRKNIFQSENVDSPFVLGIVRPRIYLPYTLNPQELEHVIAHEQAHIQRKDHWWKPLGFLLLTIHWFNPLVWTAYILLCRDIELACDEKVIRELGSQQRADYTQALVTCSVNRRMIAACPLAFGEVGVKERVKNVLNYRKPAFWVIVVSIIACAIAAVCFLTNPEQDSYDIKIVVPARSQQGFVYSDEEISPTKNQIIITSGDNLGDTEVVLMPVEGMQENIYEPAYLTPGMPVTMDAEKGVWFKIGVNIQNPTEEDMVVYVTVQNIAVRISCEDAPDSTSFEAKILEIHDGYFLVEPAEGSWELNSSDRIEVPMQNMDPALEPQVGDIITIEYSGEILETYPARLNEVYSIKVAEEAAGSPVVMVPTDAQIEGVFDGYLFLPIGDETYRYQRQDTMPGGIQAGAILHTVDTGLGDSYRYTVFAVENCTDNSMVLVHSEDMDMMWLYQYSPSKAVEADALQNAKDAGCVVMEDGDVTSGQELWIDFCDATRKGSPASVKVAHYYTLDPGTCSEQYYEAYKEDYPCLYLDELSYDGAVYTLRLNENGTDYVRTYEYLMLYTEAETVRYVLTHDDTVTWDELFAGLVSSQIGAYIDHYTIYTDHLNG